MSKIDNYISLIYGVAAENHILIPVYDDWPSLLKLVGDIHSARRAPLARDRVLEALSRQ